MAHANLIDIRKCKRKADRSALETFVVSVEFEPYIAAGSFYTIQMRIEHYLCYILFTTGQVRLVVESI
ncbi:MAG: hypothetical protein ABSG91_05170 [Syntrophobacteraceae bacterium]